MSNGRRDPQTAWEVESKRNSDGLLNKAVWGVSMHLVQHRRIRGALAAVGYFGVVVIGCLSSLVGFELIITTAWNADSNSGSNSDATTEVSE
jgi:hypothetical protein